MLDYFVEVNGDKIFLFVYFKLYLNFVDEYYN